MAGLPDRAVTPFRLLCLPLELQHNVSRQAYPPTTLRGECNAAARTSWRGAHSLNLLLACKHVHKEATPFYRASFVHLDTSELRWHHIEKSLGTSDRDWIVAVVRKVTDCCHTTLDGGPSTLEMPFESLQSFTFRCAYGGYAGFDPDEEGLHHSIEYYLQDQSTIGLLKLFVEQYFTKHRRLDILRHLGINAEFWLGLKEEYRSLHHWRVHFFFDVRIDNGSVDVTLLEKRKGGRYTDHLGLMQQRFYAVMNEIKLLRRPVESNT